MVWKAIERDLEGLSYIFQGRRQVCHGSLWCAAVSLPARSHVEVARPAGSQEEFAITLFGTDGYVIILTGSYVEGHALVLVSISQRNDGFQIGKIRGSGGGGIYRQRRVVAERFPAARG